MSHRHPIAEAAHRELLEAMKAIETKKKKPSLMYKEKSQALLSLLSWAHAEQYTGLDDEMIDDCNEWISNLSDEEVCDIALEVFHDGI